MTFAGLALKSLVVISNECQLDEFAGQRSDLIFSPTPFSKLSIDPLASTAAIKTGLARLFPSLSLPLESRAYSTVAVDQNRLSLLDSKLVHLCHRFDGIWRGEGREDFPYLTKILDNILVHTAHFSMGLNRTDDAVTSRSHDHEIFGDPSDGSTRAPPSSLLQKQQAQEPLRNTLAMGKGDGDESYSKNSGLQAMVNKMTLLALNEALEKVALPAEGGGPVVVADLGSSSGSNTIDSMALIVDKLRQRLPNSAEFQVYFNDLPSNDFNNLFLLLNADDRAKKFHAAGVPGSFFGRLFPQSSVHIFYSSNCVHWLSEIPDAVRDKHSPAYNTGRVWLKHSRSAVAKCYKQQASSDLKSFLQARAAELIPGGLLFFGFAGRSTSDPAQLGDNLLDEFSVHLDKILTDLVAEGLLTKQQHDAFNIPVYERSDEEVRETLESFNSLFHVLTTKSYKFDCSASVVFGTSKPFTLARNVKVMHKAVLNNFLEAHVGKKISEVIWQRYENLIEEEIRTRPEDLKLRNTMWIVSLIRR